MLSVFLEYNPVFINPKGEEVRYEFLNLEKYVNPANEIQREHNAMIDEIAEAIRCDRYMRMVNISEIAANTMASSTSAVINTSKDFATKNAVSKIYP